MHPGWALKPYYGTFPYGILQIVQVDRTVAHYYLDMTEYNESWHSNLVAERKQLRVVAFFETEHYFL